jgi:hypothetical protein
MSNCHLKPSALERLAEFNSSEALGNVPITQALWGLGQHSAFSGLGGFWPDIAAWQCRVDRWHFTKSEEVIAKAVPFLLINRVASHSRYHTCDFRSANFVPNAVLSIRIRSRFPSEW